MIRFLVSFITFFLVLVVAVLIVVYTGVYNVAATSNDHDLVRWMLSTTQERSIKAHAPREDVSLTLPADSASMQRGFLAYRQMCEVCHGAPGQDPGWIGQGLNPEPPDLVEAAEAFTAEEVHWVLRHGIKMTGMPALSPTHSEEEILELTAFVMQLPSITAPEYAQWIRQEEQAADSSDAPPGHDGHDHAH